jgi:hypothetical protein
MSAKSWVLVSVFLCCPSVASAAAINGIYSAVVPTDEAVNLVYTPPTGGLQVVLSGALTVAKKISSLQINSTANDFVGVKPANLSGPFDVFRADRLFKLETSGFGPTIDFGTPLAPGRSAAALYESLLVTGSFVGGGSLDQAPYRLIYSIPEPVSATLVGLCLVGCWRQRRWVRA